MQDTESRQEMGHPISPEDGQGMPGPWKESGWPPDPTSLRGIAQDRGASGFRGHAGGRTTPGGFVRTKEDKNANARALGARTLGLQEEGQSLGLGRWGCQRTISTFPKG